MSSDCRKSGYNDKVLNVSKGHSTYTKERYESHSVVLNKNLCTEERSESVIINPPYYGNHKILQKN